MSTPLPDGVCRFCRTLPGTDDTACAEYEQALRCSWLAEDGKAALVRIEEHRRAEQLIRAAPQMLEALQRIRSRLATIEIENRRPKKDELFEMLSWAVAASAAATGEKW